MNHLLYIVCSLALCINVSAQTTPSNPSNPSSKTVQTAPPPKVYDEQIDPMKQIDEALAKATKESKFVICQVGGNWCPWCLRFADFIKKDTEISQLISDNYIYIHVNCPRRNGDPKVLKRLGNPSRFGFPVLVVLRADGSVLHIQDSSFLEEGQGYDREKVLRFFSNWTPEVAD